MGFNRQLPIICEIVVDNTVQEQVNTLGYDISYEEKEDITLKVSFSKFWGFWKMF
jgi:hypothetical protein